AFDYKVILVVPAPRGPAFGRPEDRLHAAKSRNPESWRNSWVPAFAGTTTKILEPRCVHAVAPRGGLRRTSALHPIALRCRRGRLSAIKARPTLSGSTLARGRVTTGPKRRHRGEGEVRQQWLMRASGPWRSASYWLDRRRRASMPKPSSASVSRRTRTASTRRAP